LSKNHVKTLGLILNFKTKLCKLKKLRHCTVAYHHLHRQKYREVKLHFILVGVMGTNYKDYAEKPLAELNLDYHKIKKLTFKLNEHSIRHASTLIKTRNAIQLKTTVMVWVWVPRHTNPLTHTNCFFVCLCGGGLPGAGPLP
jgi:hypothetical protein